MSSADRIEIVKRFFSGNAHTYDQVVALFTLGADRAWKRDILDLLPPQGVARVLDLACGTGILTFALASRYPEAEIVGVDIMPEYLEVARRKAQQANLRRVSFIQGHAEEIVLDGAFDCITGSYLAKYADVQRLAEKAFNLLRPGGMLVMHDFTYPTHPLVAWLLDRYFQFLQVVGPRFFPEWKPVFSDLLRFLRSSRWVQDLGGALVQRGFLKVRTQYLSRGTAAIVTGERPGDRQPS